MSTNCNPTDNEAFSARTGSALTPQQVQNWKNLYPWMRGLSDFEIGKLRDMLQEKVTSDAQAPNADLSGQPPSETPNDTKKL